MKRKQRSAKLTQKMAERNNAEIERSTPYSRWADSIRAQIEKQEEALGGRVHPMKFFNNPYYKKYDPNDVYIECLKEPIYTDESKTIIKEEGFTPILFMRDKKTNEMKALWKYNQTYTTESDALWNLGKLLPLVATKHSLATAPVWNHFDPHKGKRKTAAFERQQKRLAKQAKHMAASRGHNS